MRPDDLRRLLQQRPFQPFRLYVLETTVYEIRHPEMAIVGRSTVTVHFGDPSAPLSLPEHNVIIALIHITKLELTLRTVTPSANGN